MLIFTLAISCLTTCNLPWFMNLTFPVPMQYCSLQHWTLLLPPDTSTIECHFCFGSASSFFLGLLVIAIHSSPVGHHPTWRAYLPVSYFFAFSLCSWDAHNKNTGVVCHSLLQWTTFCQNSPLWPVCLGWLYTAWLIASLSYTSPFAVTSLWSMYS